MELIPAQPRLVCSSDAERRLARDLGKLDWETWSALHSLRLDRHDYRVCGEIDFLLLSERALIVVEVKGGGISRDAKGVWHYRDRYGVDHRSGRGPFRQAEEAMFSLRSRLGEQFEPGIPDLLFGWCVCLPDVTFDLQSPEWAPEIVIDERDCASPENLGRALLRVVAYWERKFGCRRTTPERVWALREHLRPSFERVPTLRHLADLADERTAELTSAQYRLLDAVHTNPRIICEGGAGTGKSFVALEATRRHLELGEDVLFCARSRHLIAFLSTRPAVQTARFSAYEDIANQPPADVLVVDEAQDLMSTDALAALDLAVRGGLNSGRWRVFLDPNAQADLVEPFDRDVYSLLTEMGTSLVLDTNCRNTETIVTQIRALTGADMGVATAGRGPEVVWRSVVDIADEAHQLEGWLACLLMQERFEPGNITLLEFSPDDSPVGQLPAALRKQIVRVDDTLCRAWPSRTLTASSITDFKGLENQAVCVTGLRSLRADPSGAAALYVAMSRARAMLWIALPPEAEAAVREIAAQRSTWWSHR